jgi:hypothetical protein
VDGFFRAFIPLTLKLKGSIVPPGPLSLENLNKGLASSSQQPVLPWSIPEAMGINVDPFLDLSKLPFALCVHVKRTDGASFNVLLQLQVSPAFVKKRLPSWSEATSTRMYCWRQCPPVTPPTPALRNNYWLFQFSTIGNPELTLFYAQDRLRKPVACFKDFYFVTGFASPSTSFCTLRVTIRQAYVEEPTKGVQNQAHRQTSCQSESRCWTLRLLET